MNAPLRQSDRLGRLTTGLGPDTLALLRFDGTDYLNDLFEYRVEALSTRDDLDFDALIGTHATVEIDSHDGPRPFDGIVTQARWAGVGENGHRYDLVLRPWFWLASRRRNQRIFHHKTVVQILRELLSDYAHLGDPALEISLTNDYPELEYTVQYRESDLDFARRLMERFGISFHFRHAPGSHTLTLTDDPLSHPEIGKRPFKSYDGHHQAEGEHFWDWAPERNLTTGAVRLTDYDFKAPMRTMEINRLGDAAYAEGQIESFDYPGDYLTQDVGKIVAGLRTDQERGADRRNRAVGDCVSLGAGMRVTLSGDPVPGTGETYLCLSASHHFVSEAYGSGSAPSDGYAFTGSYVLMPDTAPMAPPRRTPAALVNGPQTAMVVGEGEIDCDEYGRILVRFHWDLEGAHSMRCRVSQNWAGSGWGGMVIPRIGMEVLVEFLEGDPDKPVVTGCVYNGRNQVPYDLPENKTRSTFRTDTHEGQGFNELRFDDERGLEEIYLHAQRDWTCKVENHYTERVDNMKIISVGASCLTEVRLSDVHNIGTNMIVNVGVGPEGAFVRHPRTKDVEGIREAGYAYADASRDLSGSGTYALNAVQNVSIAAGRNLDVNTDNDISVQAGRHTTTTVRGSATHSSGKDHNQLAGGSMRIEAHQGLHLRCGASELIMRPDGTVLLNGRNLTQSFSDDIRLTSARIDLN